MYFNNDKNDTNIDKDFNDKTNFVSKLIDVLNKYKFFIFSGVILVIFVIVFISFFNNSSKSYLILAGDETITLYQGNDFIEPGYDAYDKKDNNLVDDVKINSNLNINEPGEYEIKYELNGITKTRKVKIVPKENKNSYTFIYLNTVNNDVNIYLKVGDKYNEPGYKVFNSNGKNLNDSVKITGNVNTSKKGTYRLTYSVIDENDVTISSTRNVIVMDMDIKLSTKYTDGKTYIDVVVNDEYFSYLILPDGTKITKTSYTYSVNKIGKYTFTSYNKMGISKSASINIDTLDRTPPKINYCKAVVNGSSTKFTISSNDSDVSKYIINNNSALTYTSSSFTVNRVIDNAKVYVYDTSNNYSYISCSYTYQNSSSGSSSSGSSSSGSSSSGSSSSGSSSSGSSSSGSSSSGSSSSTTKIYDPIKPTGKEKIEYNESTETLKVWIEKVTRKNRIDFHVTHIWVKDPYKQFKSQVSDNYGKELLQVGTLFKNAIKKHKLTDKLAVAINGSGFVLKGHYGNSYYNVNPNFNRTATQALVISNGKIVHDITDEKLPEDLNPIYGINKNGMLTYYSFSDANTSAKRKKIYNKIIDDGILNTFTFKPILVINGKRQFSEKASDKNRRQGICQINKNNFVIISDVYEGDNADSGFTFYELSKYMVDLGCKTGVTTDGGSSANLYIKQKNKSTPTAIEKTSRSVSDIIFFHE